MSPSGCNAPGDPACSFESRGGLRYVDAQAYESEETPMLLHVNDFGCVPDGRVLERVSIAAGSADFTAVDGALRATDVGKNIAIPGALDLVATIAALPDR